MEKLSKSKSRQLYSWWWDSHISPRNSKWLQEDLTDMDKKVKSMIKLIEEDADSLSMRAEMFYKKRPELMKLVEEFYRAYRALAERYDHVTGELRHAHKAMAETFPNQLGFEGTDLLEDEKGNQCPEEDESLLLHQQCVERISDLEKKLSIALEESRNLNEKACEAESETRNLEKMISELNLEKDNAGVEYRHCSDRLSKMEDELVLARQDITRLNDIVLRETEKNVNLEEANRSLQLEADNLMKKIMIKEQELSNKRQDFMKTETLAMEMKNVLKMFKDFDSGKTEKELDIETIPSAIRYLHNENSRLIKTCNAINGEKQVLSGKYSLLEKRFTELENNQSSLRKDKESMLDRIEELKISTGPQLTILESNINLLREENRWNKKELEEELERAVNAQLEIFILQKFVQDMEEKNCALSKLTSELEYGILQQQVEVEILFEEIRKLRLSMYKVFAALEIDFDEQSFPRVLERIDDLKFFLKNYEDDYHQLLIENSVLRNDRVERDELLNVLQAKNQDLERELSISLEKLESKQDMDLELSRTIEAKMITEDLEDQIVELLEEWESDASAFYLDLQYSNVLQVVYQCTVLELVKSFETLEENHMELVEQIVFFPLDPSVVNNLEAKDHESVISKKVITSVEAVDTMVTKNMLKLDEDMQESIKPLTEKEMDVGNVEQPKWNNILERLSSDSERLANLKMRTLGLLIKVAISERNKKMRKKMKKSKGLLFDFEGVKEELTEIEEAVIQLESLNNRLKRDMEEIPSSSSNENSQMKRVSEMGRQGSEHIAGLELEFAKIQFDVMKLEEEEEEEEEEKRRGQVGIRFSNKNNVSVISIQNGKRGIQRRKKPFLSGCFYPDSTPRPRISM